MASRFPRKNYLYWDIVDYPPPKDWDFESFYDDIRDVLGDEGYYNGHLCIKAYCEKDKNMHEELDYLQIPFQIIPHGTRHERLSAMALDMLALRFRDVNPYAPPPPMNFFLFLKDTPEDDSELARVVHFLSERGCKFVLVLPDDDEESAYPNMPPSCTRWPWNRLAAGKGPIPHSSSDDSDDAEEEGSSPKRPKIDD